MKKLEEYLNYYTKTFNIPRADCIVYKGGRKVFEFSGGSRAQDGKKIYRMYSVTKPVVCAAALKLAEQGKIHMCDPLYKYYPEFRSINVRVRGENGKGFELKRAENPILIKHLFTMTAGFDYNIHSVSIRKYIKETEGKFPTQTIVKALSEQPLDFEPGTHWKYSLCHDVLGALVEKVSDTELNSYVRKTIFEPLGMDTASLICNGQTEEKLVPQMRFDAQSVQVIPTFGNEHVLGSEYVSGGAGLISTAEDMIKFTDMLAARGKGVLKPQTIDLMRSNHVATTLLGDIALATNQGGYGYGLGVRTLVNPLAADALSPIGEFGWGGASGSYLMADCDNYIAMFYAQNLLGASLTHHHRLRNALYADMRKTIDMAVLL